VGSNCGWVWKRFPSQLVSFPWKVIWDIQLTPCTIIYCGENDILLSFVREGRIFNTVRVPPQIGQRNSLTSRWVETLILLFMYLEGCHTSHQQISLLYWLICSVYFILYVRNVSLLYNIFYLDQLKFYQFLTCILLYILGCSWLIQRRILVLKLFFTYLHYLWNIDISWH
jgi:hypothetical protein